MNKYQEYLLQGMRSKEFYFSLCCPLEEESSGKSFYGNFDKATDTFTITQSSNINLLKYVLLISQREPTFDKVFVEKNGESEEIATADYKFGNRTFPCCFRIVVDFNDRADKIRFHFKGDLADDYILKLQYVEADKDAYYAEQAKTARENLIKAAAIKHSTGNDLVNIYFQPCCDEYERTEISLYHDGQMLAKYKVEDGAYFKSIGGLAYGTYEYILKQFGKNDRVLFESDKIKFSISAPNYGGKGVVYWN